MRYLGLGGLYLEGLMHGGAYFRNFCSYTFRHMKENPKQSWILDSTQWIPDRLSVQLGFRIPIVSGIPVSLSCIPDSKARDSGFH